jgi:hypothetical protein
MIGRRTFGIGALMTAGDKLVRPLNAPPAGNASPGVQPGATSGVFVGRLVVIFGPAGTPLGLFLYAAGTTPGPGNPPIVSIIDASVDPYGNATHPGVTSQIPGGAFVSLLNGAALFTGGSEIIGAANGNLNAVAPGPDGFSVQGGPFTSTAGTPATPTVISTDEWQQLGGVTGTNTTVIFDRYMLTPEQEVLIDISLQALAGGSTAGTYTFANTLPSEYVPPGGLRVYPLTFNAPITTATQNSVLVVDGVSGPVPGRVRITIPSVAANVFYTASQRIPLT